MTFEEGRMSAWRFPCFSALEMLLRQSACKLYDDIRLSHVPFVHILPSAILALRGNMHPSNKLLDVPGRKRGP